MAPSVNPWLRAAGCSAALLVAASAGAAGRDAAAPTAKNREAADAFVLTAGKLYASAKSEVSMIDKILTRHQSLLDAATKENLVVAVDAIDKDVAAVRELAAFARDRLATLQRDLGLDKDRDGSNAGRAVGDPLQFPQVREIEILRDQAERLYRSDERFMKALRRPTELKVTRVESVADDDVAAATTEPTDDGE